MSCNCRGEAAPAAEVATQSGPVDLALLKAVVGEQGDGGKQADAKEQADTREQVEADQVTDADGPKLTTKPASQSHTDGKAQATASESDKQHIFQARGENPANSRHASPEAPAIFAADTNAAAAKSAADIAPPFSVSSQLHAAQTAAAPATLVSNRAHRRRRFRSPALPSRSPARRSRARIASRSAWIRRNSAASRCDSMSIATAT